MPLIMAPKKASGSSKADKEKRKVVRKTIEFKKELSTISNIKRVCICVD